MQIQSLIHDGGWSASLPTALDSPQTLVLAFGAPSYRDRPAPFAELRAAFPQAVMLGCSTAGEIHAGVLHDDSLSVAVARFTHTALRKVSAPMSGPDESAAVGEHLASLLDGPDLRAVFILSEGLAVNGAQLVAGLTGRLAADVAVSGGLAGDGEAFASTWVLDGAVCRDRHVVAVGLYGEALRIGMGSGGGWADFGPLRVITRARGPVLFELDGQPALDLYKTYLGDLAAGLPATALRYPLSIRGDATDPEPLVRTILGIDEAARSLIFAGDMPQGGIARLMRSNHMRLIDGASEAVRAAVAQVRGNATMPGLIVTVSCVGRRMVLGEQTEEELEAIGTSFPGRHAHVGFYSYGEISRAGGASSRLHNQTMTIAVYTEDGRD